MGPQRVWKTYTCDRIIVLKSWVYTINKKTLSHVHRLVGHLKHHQSNKLNKFVKSDIDVFFTLRIEIFQVLLPFKLGPEGRIAQ